MDNLIFALEDLIYWVQDGIDNADMSRVDYVRTLKCKKVILKHISELKRNYFFNLTEKHCKLYG